MLLISSQSLEALLVHEGRTDSGSILTRLNSFGFLDPSTLGTFHLFVLDEVALLQLRQVHNLGKFSSIHSSMHRAGNSCKQVLCTDSSKVLAGPIPGLRGSPGGHLCPQSLHSFLLFEPNWINSLLSLNILTLAIAWKMGRKKAKQIGEAYSPICHVHVPSTNWIFILTALIKKILRSKARIHYL